MRPYKTELVGTSKLGDDDIIIAFMGQTGSGKSQIIDTLTGEQGQRAGESFTSVTKDLEASRILDHDTYGSRIVLLDTPGFDDTERTDEEILRLIGEWLQKTYQEKILLSGIVYVQRITDPRMSATPHRHLFMFTKLTGPRSAKNVVLATTMWDTLGTKFDALGTKREQALKKDYWNVMIDHGAGVERFLNTAGSAWSIIDNIANKNDQRVPLLFQEEKVDRKQPLLVTGAGKALSLDLELLVQGQNNTRQVPSAWSDVNGNGTRGTQISNKIAHLDNSMPTVTDNHGTEPNSKQQDQRHATRNLFGSPLLKVEYVETKELEEGDIVILVMGPTGSGKSSFINAATGVDVHVHRHTLKSLQSKLEIIKMSFPRYNIVFVDVPGFDEVAKPDTEVLKMISNWLKIMHERNILFTGVLYFHRISDNRMAGTPLKNFRIFKELCGEKAFKNVIFTTTMWEEVTEAIGDKRENDLKNTYWKSMIDLHSRVGRFKATQDSAFHLVAPLLEANSRTALLIQKELMDLDLRLGETRVGRVLHDEIKQLAKRQREILMTLQKELKRSNDETLVQECEWVKQHRRNLLQQMVELEVPLTRKLMNAMTSILKRR